VLNATIGSIHVPIEDKYRPKPPRSRKTLVATAMQGVEAEMVSETANRIINSILKAIVIFALQTSYRERSS
jgi:hypothetical protein